MNIVEYLLLHYKLLNGLSEEERTEWLEILNILTHKELEAFRDSIATNDNSIAKTMCFQKVDELLFSASDYDNTYMTLRQDELIYSLYEVVVMEKIRSHGSTYDTIDLGWKFTVNKYTETFSIYFTARFIPSVNSILKVMEKKSYISAFNQFMEWDNTIQRHFKELWGGGPDPNNQTITIRSAWYVFLFTFSYYLPSKYQNLEDRTKLKMMCKENENLSQLIEKLGLEISSTKP